MKRINSKVLVSGGSIAGLTAAYWLKRYGFEVVVVERSKTLRIGGNGVDLRGLAVEVIKQMNIWPSVRSAAVDINGMSFVNAQNKSVSKIDMKAIQRKSKSEEVEILRGDLVSILHKASEYGIEYLFGDSIKSIEQDTQGVNVVFEHNQPRRFDLVIGADGIHSNVRRIVFGPESPFLKYRGHYFAFADADPALGSKGWTSLYNVPGKVAGVYRANNQSGAKAYFAFRRREPLAYDYANTEQQKQILKDVYAGVGWQVPELLRAAAADPNFYFDSLSQVIMPSWSSGRVVLVGDAAFCASPASGAGATLSVVGAYRLAGELYVAYGDYGVGMRRYENGYRGTVVRTQSQIFTGLLVPKTRLGIWGRNILTNLPIMGALTTLEQRLAPQKEQLPIYPPQESSV